MKKFILFCLLFCGVTAKAHEISAPLVDTQLVFILDRSGSMGGLESDTIGGFNAMLEKQKKEKGLAFVTTVLFDHKYELLHNRIPLEKVSPITEKEYFVRGNTALLDAIGKTIVNVKQQQKASEKMKSERVLFVIITDGMENASQEFKLDKVKQLITEQQKKQEWEFLFLGANIDAINTAESFGIDKSRAVEYISDSQGTQMNYKAVNSAVQEVRRGKQLDESWKAEIEADVKERKK
ncbi:vWA domain-containing protein [Frederiksenia canicola]|uniref:VWFA domain-containing protein n=1 Tax=Frederiksenia canicola TaxID=123824 RepID=A0AAE6X6H2_9PAST|nr:vWA domain-containing protein [Frederiksenia canicola]QIM65740.1 hypothetical protein A4G17_09900 [Frederiksenia canicola]RPE95799.1 hypothetical protein EDC49_0175 [Frederiksenia canicola]